MDSLTEDLINNKISTEEIYAMSDDPWNQSCMLCKEKKNIVKFLADYANRFLRCKKIMDVGCGNGGYCNFLKNHTFYKKIIGIDNATNAIVKARNLHKDIQEISFDVIDITERTNITKINEHKPDIFLMSDITWCIIEHISEFRRYLKENHKGKYLLHIIILPEHQNITPLITDHQSVLNFFKFKYIFDGEFYKNSTNDEIKSVSYFLAKIQ